jgi:Flp pilus assembly protein TadG
MKTRARMGREDGAAAVEMALVLPLLVLLVFGIIEFGFIFNRKITITHAAREGVRTYSLTGDKTKACTAALDAAPDISAGSKTCNAYATPPANGLDCDTPDPVTTADGTQVTVGCAYTYELPLYFFEGAVTVSSTAKARRE